MGVIFLLGHSHLTDQIQTSLPERSLQLLLSRGIDPLSYHKERPVKDDILQRTFGGKHTASLLKGRDRFLIPDPLLHGPYMLG